MCWTDRIATANILKLKDEFKIDTAISTGTFRGADAELYSKYFKHVFSMDIDNDNLKIARKRLKSCENVRLMLRDSAEFIKGYRSGYEFTNRNDTIFFYLDAHFYNPHARPENKWIVVNELKALEGFKNCVIVIHDFDCEGLGHLIYDGEHMGWNVIGEHIQKVNPDFHYYCNTREMCDIVTEQTIDQVPIKRDASINDALEFVHSSDTKRYRGILYAIQKPLDLSKYQLKEFNHAI